jgi:hypothetical protein
MGMDLPKTKAEFEKKYGPTCPGPPECEANISLDSYPARCGVCGKFFLPSACKDVEEAVDKAKQAMSYAIDHILSRSPENTDRRFAAEAFESMAQRIRDGDVDGPVEMRWIPGDTIDAKFNSSQPFEFVKIPVKIDL